VRVVLFMVLLLGGILFLVSGLFLTRLTWRTDVAPFGRRSRAFQIALHPENFAKPDRLREIRLLNFLGAVLLLGAVVVVGYDIFISHSGG
jgi:hypothetical protein